ncbi:MAG: prolyl-tRNA synthetase, partial [Candidatus Moranbacteria bacterium]|nr:prolyl-tRNA synthetase [Candidatus Moranbacteria bacterium]
IFSFGGTKSEQLGLYFKDDDGSQKPVILGSYGIGITRLMGIVIEKFADEKGLVWPESVAPFKAHLISLGADERVEQVYTALTEAGIEVLYDDRDARAGEKFADSDLLGIPYRVVIGKRSAESGEAEVKRRTGEETEMVGISGLVKYFDQ